MLLNSSAAFEFVKKLIVSKGYKIRMVSIKNNGRHLLVECVDEFDRFMYFYVLFKQEFVHSFNLLFPSFVGSHPDYAGFGESINVDCLEYAKNRDATLLYIYPNENTYMVDSNFLYNFVTSNMLVRTQERKNTYKTVFGYGETKTIMEEEYCFPIKLLIRYD